MMNRHGPASRPGLARKLPALAGGALLLVLGFMFSVVLLAVLAVAGLVAWGYVWWKTRQLRRDLGTRPAGGHVIDGEVVVVDDFPVDRRPALPGEPPPR